MEELANKAIKIGSGLLTWPRSERETDRYGIILVQNPIEETIKSLSGAKGRIIVRVVASFVSQHTGDIVHGWYPSKPEIGSEFVLGVGWFFVDIIESLVFVGVVPEDGRDSQWMDGETLYKVVDQEVDIFFLVLED